MSTYLTSSDRFVVAQPRDEPTVRRLGERTCVIALGAQLGHVDLPPIEDAVRSVLREGCEDLVFDLTEARFYETFALVRIAREWDRLAAAGCAVYVAARDPRVVADLERLSGTDGWTLHGSAPHALRALLSAPLD